MFLFKKFKKNEVICMLDIFEKNKYFIERFYEIHKCNAHQRICNIYI